MTDNDLQRKYPYAIEMLSMSFADDDDEWTRVPTLQLPDGWDLKKTCGACPEQYELFDADGIQVGYFRLRHGWFRVDSPDHMGETVYSTSSMDDLGESDGIFTSEEIRVTQMQKGVNAILELLNAQAAEL